MKTSRLGPSSCTRSQRGSLGVLLCSFVFMGILGIGAFAADVSHNVTVRSELQNAADAAAMAGARALINEDTAPLAEYNALEVARINSADGKSVTNDETGSVSIDFPPPDANQIGVCKVTASREIKNWLSSVFGHPTDTITAVATAAASQAANRINANMLFPVAVSLDAGPELNKSNGNTDPQYANYKPLKDLKIGDRFKMYLNSQQIKNACYTSFNSKNTNASWLSDAVDMYAGITPPQPNFIPEATAGDTIFLQNGTATSVLGKEPRTGHLTDRDIVVMPVITGKAEMNQSRTLVGWITVKLESIKKESGSGSSEVLTGILMKSPLRGHPGDLPSTNDNQWDQALEQFSPSIVHLISSR
ncbi:MAG: hypothetical protein K2W95_18830 [Candidatus Obscuribacterales bacterium]|nr:hypothetical protein [Candidatus Obscuribacterales bacterium]